MQAWEEHCRRKGECGKHPQVPNRAYLINLPEDTAKLEYSQKLLGELGFDVEIIKGVKSVQVRVLSLAASDFASWVRASRGCESASNSAGRATCRT